MASEFGSGIVVCLAKFSEHLMSHGPFSENEIRDYAEWTAEEKEYCMTSAKRHPHGDAANKLMRMSVYESMRRRGTKNQVISDAIELWMNGASDHFYDLDERAPAPLKELADLCLKIGHRFTGETYTIETLDKIRELWRDSCLAVDAMLGVEADWGEW